jgi:hypothetical protein
MRATFIVAGIATAVFVAGAFAYVDADQRPRYEPGVARIERYALGETPTQLVIYFVSGAGDIVQAPSVTEAASDVSVAVPTSVFVPGRGTFKNSLSGTLGRATIPLREPLAARAVIDAGSGTPVMRQPARP